MEHSGYMLNSTKFIIIICCLLIFQGLFSMALFTPSMPAITEHFGTEATYVKLALTWYLFSYGISQLFYGALSDSFGRKPIMLISFVIMIIGNFITVFAANIQLFVIGHAVAGFGGGAGSTLSRAIIQESTSESEFAKAFAIVMVCASLGTTSGPIAGGIIQENFGWEVCFYLSILISIVLFIIVLLFLPETNLKPKRVSTKLILKEYLHLFNDKLYVVHALIIALIFGLSISYYSMTPFLYQKLLGYSALDNGIFSLVILFSVFSGAFILNKTIKKYSSKFFFISGLICFGCCSTLLVLFSVINLTNIYVLLFPSMILFMGIGLSNPVFTSKGLQKHRHHPGIAGAMQSAIKVLGSFIIGLIVAHLSEHNILPFAIVCFTQFLLIILLYVWVYP